ncbi:MAG: DUF1232 domain-containing protein [Polyangiaceae bacterium]|nr:DUF1232 domain-containing protein [Polyangiaceae bacterium]
MTQTTDAKYLEIFPSWLRTLGDDAKALSKLVATDAPETSRRFVAAGLNYIFKSLDLIPDGIDDLGFLDDAFVVRVAARFAAAEGMSDATITRLAEEAASVEEFLGVDFPRLEAYVRGLLKGAARGRTVDDIIGDDGIRSSFVNEVEGWGTQYAQPSFTRDPKTLIKLRAFLSAKLP